MIEQVQGRIEEALDSLNERIERNQEVRNLQNLYGAYFYLSWIALIKKDFDLGKSVAQEMIDLAELGVGYKPIAYSIMSRIYSLVGQIQEAIHNLDEAQKAIDTNKDRYIEQMILLWAQTYLFVAQQKWEKAWQAFQELIQLTALKGFRWHRALALTDWADALLKRGRTEDLEKARELLQEAQREYQDMGAHGFVELVAEKISAFQ